MLACAGVLTLSLQTHSVPLLLRVMATYINDFDDPPGAAAPRRRTQPAEHDAAADVDAAAASGDVEALRRAFAAQLAAQEQRHAVELRTAMVGDSEPLLGATRIPLLGATKRLLAEADAVRASRNQGADDGSDEEDVFAGPTTDGGARPPADVARAMAAARALPEHRRHDAYAVDLCLAEHAWAARDWGRARISCRRVLRAAERVATKAEPPQRAVAVLERARASRGRAAAVGDVNALEASLANGDFELASLLAEQVAARLDPPAAGPPIPATATGVAPAASATVVEPPAAPPTPGLPGGWEQKTAADGRTYYFDHVHQQTSWDRYAAPPSRR